MLTRVRWQRVPHRWVRGAGLAVIGVVTACVAYKAVDSATSTEKAIAASGPPLNVHVFVSSRTDVCFDPGDIAAISRMTSDQQALINRLGGIAGRPVQVIIHDDARDEKKLIANMRSALTDPRALAMVGVSSSMRAKPAFSALGNQLKASGIPFITDLSVDNLFEGYPNVFTTRPSVDDDSAPIAGSFMRQLGFSRPVFIGTQDAPGVDALSESVRSSLGAPAFLADKRVTQLDGKVSPDDIAARIAELQTLQPDVLFLYMGAQNTEEFLKQLTAAKLFPAIFSGSQLDATGEAVAQYRNAIYALTWDSPPEVINNRLRRMIAAGAPEDFVFAGRRIGGAPGWATGECKALAQSDGPDPLSAKNLRAVTRGSQFADMVGLVSAAAGSAASRITEVQALRGQIVRQLSSAYQTGRGSFKGAFDNWSFVEGRRSAARVPFVVIIPQQLGRIQLAPVQFARTRDGSLARMDTFYLDVDLIKAHRIDENEKTFFAEFYLSIRDNEGAAIDKIEFANAYLDVQSNSGRQLAVEVIHPGGKSANYPEAMKIYKVAGRFLFEPELANYPFDTQRFSIDIQPKSGAAPFIIQAPPLELRDKLVVSDGWDVKDQYVGYERDFVPVVDAYSLQPSVVPFFRSSFVWIMQRHSTDYLLRVAIPLGFILLVAYCSIFIPPTHFEAVVTIQVTALLSAVALYLSLPELSSDTATFSDRAFVFAYMIVSLMIGVSILRVSPALATSDQSERLLRLAHIVTLPLLLAAGAYYFLT